MMGRVNRIRMEAAGRTKEEVESALEDASLFIAQSFGGAWVTDDEHPQQIQTTAKGFWGFVWLKRVRMR